MMPFDGFAAWSTPMIGFPGLLLHAIALTASMTIAGCAAKTERRIPTGGIEEGGELQDWACIAFRPISWSGRDTPETVRQIAAHNAAWDAACRDGG
jgi:hypothetical protein